MDLCAAVVSEPGKVLVPSAKQPKPPWPRGQLRRSEEDKAGEAAFCNPGSPARGLLLFRTIPASPSPPGWGFHLQ